MAQPRRDRRHHGHVPRDGSLAPGIPATAQQPAATSADSRSRARRSVSSTDGVPSRAAQIERCRTGSALHSREVMRLGASMKSDLITIDPEIHSGTPVFRGTRVPVKTMFDHLEAGDPLEVFLDDFPSVSRELAVAVLEQAHAALLPDAYPAR